VLVSKIQDVVAGWFDGWIGRQMDTVTYMCVDEFPSAGDLVIHNPIDRNVIVI